MINIIVPIYNVEKYLIRCLDSIQKQDGEFKAILVDDGSTDLCPSLCEQYAKDDCRFMVLHKQNGGLSSAIKYGIINSSPCDYYMFVDGDDSLVENAVKTVQEIINGSNSDIIMYDFNKIYDNGKSQYVTCDAREGYASGDDYFKIQSTFQNTGSIVPARWNKVFKSSIVNRIIDIYSDRVSVAEDMLFTTLSLYNSTSIFYKKVALVNYYQNSSSMMNNYKPNYVASYLEVYHILRCELESNILPASILFQNTKTMIQQLFNSDYKNKLSECHRVLKINDIQEMLKTVNCSNNKDKLLVYLMKNRMGFILYILSSINRKKGVW